MRQTYRFRVPCSICQHTLGSSYHPFVAHSLQLGLTSACEGLMLTIFIGCKPLGDAV